MGCRDALESKDYAKFGELMDQNFDTRRRLFGDAVLGSVNLRMIETARSVGGARQTVNIKCRTPLQNMTRRYSCTIERRGGRMKWTGTAHWHCHPDIIREIPSLLQKRWNPMMTTEFCLHVSAAAKFTGSGGAIVAFCSAGRDQEQQLKAACEQEGFMVMPVEIGPQIFHAGPVL